jgi:hypothetical protein
MRSLTMDTSRLLNLRLLDGIVTQHRAWAVFLDQHLGTIDIAEAAREMIAFEDYVFPFRVVMPDGSPEDKQKRYELRARRQHAANTARLRQQFLAPLNEGRMDKNRALQIIPPQPGEHRAGASGSGHEESIS